MLLTFHCVQRISQVSHHIDQHAFAEDQRWSTPSSTCDPPNFCSSAFFVFFLTRNEGKVQSLMKKKLEIKVSKSKNKKVPCSSKTTVAHHLMH